MNTITIPIPLTVAKIVATVTIPEKYCVSDLEEIIKVIKGYFPKDKFYKEPSDSRI